MNIKFCAAITGLAFGGLVLAGCAGTDHAAQPAPATTTSAPTTRPPVTVVPPATSRANAGHAAKPANVIGPAGWGRFKLGMTKQAALATGELVQDEVDSDGFCTRYRVRNGGRVAISEKVGVVRIQGTSTARTPEGIGTGAAVREVKKAYPNAREWRLGFSTPVPGSATASYVFISSSGSEPYRDIDKIDEIRLESNNYDCMLASY